MIKTSKIFHTNKINKKVKSFSLISVIPKSIAKFLKIKTSDELLWQTNDDGSVEVTKNE